VALQWLISHEPVIAIPNTSRIERLEENSTATEFKLTPAEVLEIDTVCSLQQRLVDTRSIKIHFDEQRPFYQTIEEALGNHLGLVPSPRELAEQIKDGEFLKPVRLVRGEASEVEFEVLEGRLRYWAWVIAHGDNVPIPALIDGDD